MHSKVGDKQDILKLRLFYMAVNKKMSVYFHNNFLAYESEKPAFKAGFFISPFLVRSPPKLDHEIFQGESKKICRSKRMRLGT